MRQRIETERLLLRPMELRDAADIHRHCQDPDIPRNTARLPLRYTQFDAEMFILIARARQGKFPSHVYAITDKTDDRLIGSCGVFKRRPDDADWEIGYWLGQETRGKGIATEAARGLCDAIAQDLAPPRITAGHFGDNPASGRVLEKLGFTYTGSETRLFCMGRMAYATSRDMALAL